MSLMGIITNSKNEEYMVKELSDYFPSQNIIFITDKNIENRIEEINKELEKIRKVEKKFPQGELQCFKNENRYKWKIKEENGLRYLPKTERNQAEILALKNIMNVGKKNWRAKPLDGKPI